VIGFDSLHLEEGQSTAPKVKMGGSRSADMGSGEAEGPSPLQEIAEAIGDNFIDLLSLFHVQPRVIPVGSVG